MLTLLVTPGAAQCSALQQEANQAVKTFTTVVKKAAVTVAKANKAVAAKNQAKKAVNQVCTPLPVFIAVWSACL